AVGRVVHACWRLHRTRGHRARGQQERGRSAAVPAMDSLSHLCQEAIRELDEGVKLPPLQLTEEVDVAEQAVVRLRDELIHRLRAEPDSGHAAQWRAGLLHANTALSLIVGV